MKENSLNLAHQIYLSQQKKDRLFIAFFLLLSLVIITSGIFFGPLEISISDLFEPSSFNFEVIRDIRFPRIVAAFFIGGGLALVGAVLQALFSNPLADAGLIGISAGAMVSVVIGVVLIPYIPGLSVLFDLVGNFSLPILAFAGGLLLVTMVYRLSLIQGKVDIPTMLLSGVAVNALAGAITGLIIYMANDSELRTITFWTMGSLNGMMWKGVFPVVSIVIAGSLYLFSLREEINCLMAGERQAICLGIDVEKLKRKTVLICALIAGASVSLTGIIGFVGLIVPHMVRSMVRVQMSLVMTISFFTGGCFLVLADMFSRTVVQPSELPIGITTSLVGAPYFIYLLMKNKRGSRA